MCSHSLSTTDGPGCLVRSQVLPYKGRKGREAKMEQRERCKRDWSPIQGLVVHMSVSEMGMDERVNCNDVPKPLSFGLWFSGPRADP